MHQQPAVRAVVVELAEQKFDLPAGNAQPQVIAGDGFERVGFVEDRGLS